MVSFWRRRRYVIIVGGSALFTGVAAGACCLYGIYKFYHTEIVPTTVHDIDGKYIYVNRNSEDTLQQVHDRIPYRVDKYLPEFFRPSNLVDGQAELDPKLRGAKIDEMTRHQWTDSDAFVISQAVLNDPAAMIAIARSQVYDGRLLFRPAKLKSEYLETSLRKELVKILDGCSTASKKLVKRKEDSVKYATKKPNFLSSRIRLVGIPTLFPVSHNKESASVFFVGPPSDNQVIQNAIVALSELSEDPECCVQMRAHGVIRIINRFLSETRHSTLEDDRCVARILANVTANVLNAGLIEEISRSPILKTLANWMNATDLDLSLRGTLEEASKALANLDMESDPDIFSSGIYLLHSLRRPTSEPEFDVIFVHGLRGSVLKTWRQNVKMLKQLHHNQIATDEPYLYTQCWPKDWLSLDFPASRIIAVDYETSFVLSTFPPLATEDFGDGVSVTERRSLDLITRLKQAGLGSRPVIWISHSMGGLLVKQMLLWASENEAYRDIVDKTIACVFYSTPHLGSPVAEQFAKYFKVSPEVRDLRINNPYLLELQSKFAELVQTKMISLLSFGETLPDYRIISTRFVPLESANPKLGKFVELGDVTHFYSCKPVNPKSTMYLELVQFIREMIALYCGSSVASNAIASEAVSQKTQ